ncbi:MAG: hypothetical protein HKL87_01690 [Acidimicrobiaceae bacterium]|nr:hypothetical protein [Acidimicrobiaceae bacterium]
MSYADWDTQGSTSYLASAFPFPSVWSFSQFGSFAVLATRVSVPFSLVGALARMHLSFALSERLVFVIPFIVATWYSVKSLGNRIGASSELIILATVMYLVNFSTIDWYAGGWFPILIAYGLTPLALSQIVRWIERPTFLGGWVLGAVAGTITILDVRNGIIVAGSGIFLVLLAHASGEPNFQWISKAYFRNHLSTGAFGAFAFFLALSPQLASLWLDAARHLHGATLPSTYYSVSQLSQFSYYSLADTMSLFNPWWPHFLFFQTQSLLALPTFSLLPLLSIVFLTLRPTATGRQKTFRQTGLGLYLSGSSLAAGADSPFRGSNTFLWTHVPGFPFFRNPELWMQLTLLGALLILLSSAGSFADFANFFYRLREGMGNRRIIARAVAAALVTSWVFVQGGTILAHTFTTPTGNLTAHTSPAAAHVVSFLNSKPASILWIPTSPANVPDHAVSSQQLSGLSLNPKNGVATFPNLSIGNVASGGPIYPALFSSPTVAWSLVNQYRIGYIVVDRFSPPWENIGFPNQAIPTESVLAQQGFPLVFQNSEFRVYRANPTPAISVTTVSRLSQKRSRQSEMKVSGPNFPPTTSAPQFGSGSSSNISKNKCSLASTNCVTLTARARTVTIISAPQLFHLVPGDRLKITVRLNPTRLRSGVLRVNQLCDGTLISISTFDQSSRPLTAQTQYEYTGKTTYTHCQIALQLANDSAQGASSSISQVSIAWIKLQTVPSGYPASLGVGNLLVFGGHTHSTGHLHYTIKTLAQNSWRVSLSSSPSPRAITLWQSFSTGWALQCPHQISLAPTEVNGWAMLFKLPSGAGIACTLSFPAQSSENLVVGVSTFTLVVILLILWWRERQSSSSREKNPV